MSLAIIAGSGLGELSAAVEVETETPFAAIPGVGAATIAGHAGRIVSGHLEGRPCQLILGRRHFYEGDPKPIEHLVQYIADRGATTLLVTSAVGALRRDLRTGELVVIRDIIDAQNREARAGGAGRRPRQTRRGNERGESGPGWPATGPARVMTGPVASLH
ncbi:MAG TPA: purine-nucleoside phosphorylase, partial [Candidatus Krumholzibacteria bacterium]